VVEIAIAIAIEVEVEMEMEAEAVHHESGHVHLACLLVFEQQQVALFVLAFSARRKRSWATRYDGRRVGGSARFICCHNPLRTWLAEVSNRHQRLRVSPEQRREERENIRNFLRTADRSLTDASRSVALLAQASATY